MNDLQGYWECGEGSFFKLLVFLSAFESCCGSAAVLEAVVAVQSICSIIGYCFDRVVGVYSMHLQQQPNALFTTGTELEGV